MKKRIILIFLFSIIASSLFGSEWIITIIGIRQEKKGTLLLAVYPGEEGYMDDSKIIHGAELSITDSELQFTVKDLPPGEYSFAILHDEDGDKEMKMGAIMPKEGFAFSGKKQPAGMPPKYKNAFVTLDSKVVHSSAEMKYY